MPTIRIAGFSGLIPRSGPSLLAQNQAQVAQNAKLQSGEIRAWRKPTLVFSPVQNAVVGIHKMVGPANASQWLEWTTDVNVCNSPVVDLADYRIYYTGSGTPKKTNWALATSGSGAKPGAYYEMGVPAPVSAPALSASGGTAPTETRAYVYTYVSTFGTVKEESAPSVANLVTCNSSGSTVVINGFAAAPAGAYNITAIRIYRSVSGATTSSYLQVAEIAIGAGTYSDTLTVAQLGALLYSTYFTPPPAGLTGLVTMPNGILAGFVANQVWFSEPFYPHAWPSTYSLTVDYPIIGLGVFNNTLVVCTTRNPYLITGTSPAGMSQERLAIPQPCVSKRSIVYDQFGVLYASPDGLVAIGPGVQDVITAKLMTRDDWTKKYPQSMVGMLYDNHYLGFYYTGSVYTGICFARNDDPMLSQFDFPAAGVFTESATGNVFAVSNSANKIYQLDADNINNGSYTWKSMKYTEPRPTNFAVIKVDADYVYMNDTSAYTAAIAAFSASNLAIFTAAGVTTSLGGTLDEQLINGMMINGSNMANGYTNPLDFRSGAVIVYADNVQVFSAGLTSMEPLRMPSGFMAYEWEVQFTGNIPVRGFAMSTSMTELKQSSAGMR